MTKKEFKGKIEDIIDEYIDEYNDEYEDVEEFFTLIHGNHEFMVDYSIYRQNR